MIRSYLKLVILFSFIFLQMQIQCSEKIYDYFVILRFYEGPIPYLKWELALFRVKGKTYFQSRNYNDKTWKRKISHNDYKDIVQKVNESGIKNIYKSQTFSSQSSYYSITTGNTMNHKTIRISAYPPYYGKYSDLTLLVRSMKNYTVLYAPE